MIHPVEKELSELRIMLIDEIVRCLPKEQKYINLYGLPYCAGIKYVHSDGRICCYAGGYRQLEFLHFDELPVEALVGLARSLNPLYSKRI